MGYTLIYRVGKRRKDRCAHGGRKKDLKFKVSIRPALELARHVDIKKHPGKGCLMLRFYNFYVHFSSKVLNNRRLSSKYLY